MSARKLVTGAVSASVVAATVALAVPAQADPPFTPVSTDLIGVGSDTTMYALTNLADGSGGVAGYNASHATGRIASWDAKIFGPDGTTQVNSATIPLPDGTAIERPNGSGAGKQLLYGPSNPNIDFARSSSKLSDAEISAGLQAFPFAKDSLAMATATSSHAPASLSGQQVLDIYEGRTTNWNEIGGSSGTIVPFVPQTGSGTRSFFLDQLTAIKGSAVTLAGSVQEVQEHDPSKIQGNANAVAPFSIGRNTVAGSPLRIEGGFTAARALYNVVRGADVAKPEITSVFGATGFVCSAQAASLILDAGFEQLLPKSQGGACGVPTQAATSNLATAKVSTSTSVAGTSASAGQLTLTASVTGGGSLKPQGVVSFTVDGVAVGSGIVSGAKATLSKTGLAGGAHTVVATYTPSTGSAFNASQSPATPVAVRADSPAPAPAPAPTSPSSAKTKLKAKFAKSYAKGAPVKGKLVVKEKAAGAAKGKVVVKLGKLTVGKAKVKKGVASLKLKGLKPGKNKLKAVYKPSTGFKGSKSTFVITITKG